MRLRRGQRRRQVDQQVRARQQRQATALRQFARRVLEPEVAHLRGRRPDEGDAGALAVLGEAGVLGQKTVAGMNRFGTRAARGVEDAVLVAGNSRPRARGRGESPRRHRAHAARSHRCRNRPRRRRGPWPCSVRRMRQAIAPRLAISIFRNIAQNHPGWAAPGRPGVEESRRVVPPVGARVHAGSQVMAPKPLLERASGCRRCRDC